MKCLNPDCGKDIDTALTIREDYSQDPYREEEDFCCTHCGAPYRATTRIVIDYAPKYSYASAIDGVPVHNPKDWPGKYNG